MASGNPFDLPGAPLPRFSIKIGRTFDESEVGDTARLILSDSQYRYRESKSHCALLVCIPVGVVSDGLLQICRTTQDRPRIPLLRDAAGR